MNPILAQAVESVSPHAQDMMEILTLVAHSVGLGIALMFITIITSTRNGAKSKTQEPLTVNDVLFNSSNVLYLCVGMTSVMLLVNNNLARAFAIGAAIALVRFRIKMDSKNFAMCLFYGVIIGMAVGVEQVVLAYALTVVFGVLQASILLASKVVANRVVGPISVKKEEVKASVLDLKPAEPVKM